MSLSQQPDPPASENLLTHLPTPGDLEHPLRIGVIGPDPVVTGRPEPSAGQVLEARVVRGMEGGPRKPQQSGRFHDSRQQVRSSSPEAADP